MRDEVAAGDDFEQRAGVTVSLESTTRRHDDAVHADTRIRQHQRVSGQRRPSRRVRGTAAAAGALVRNSTSMKCREVVPMLRTMCV